MRSYRQSVSPWMPEGHRQSCPRWREGYPPWPWTRSAARLDSHVQAEARGGCPGWASLHCTPCTWTLPTCLGPRSPRHSRCVANIGTRRTGPSPPRLWTGCKGSGLCPPRLQSLESPGDSGSVLLQVRQSLQAMLSPLHTFPCISPSASLLASLACLDIHKSGDYFGRGAGCPDLREPRCGTIPS